MSARRILVVDDNDDVRYILVVLLERSGGYETLEAVTGQEAVEKAISDTRSYSHGYPLA